MTGRARKARAGSFGQWLAPPRFLAFLALLPVGYFTYRHFVPGAEWKDAAAMAFDFAAACFLASLVPLLRDSDTSTMRRHARENDVDVFYWIDERFGYALSGNTGREDMLRLATLVYGQYSR